MMPTARALAKAGAKLDFHARPAFDAAQAHRVYLTLLLANIATRRNDLDQLAAARAQLRDDDHSDDALVLRASTASFKEIFDVNQAREQLRWAWHDFFGQHDLLLTPITATAAFAPDHSEPMNGRKLRINGVEHPFFAQLFWAGLASAPFLPATAAPVGLNGEGLPVGLQIVGPEFADLSTIWLAGELGKLIGGYQRPPGY